jgi:hypothetical protein
MSLLRLIRPVYDLVRELAVDALHFVGLSFRSRTALIPENLFLRKQLALYQEHQIRPRRLTNAARFSLVIWSRLFAWRSALVVKPATLIGWHRKAFRVFWKRQSKPGRRRIPRRLRQLIEQMVGENPIWGEERIANELWLKLAFSQLVYAIAAVAKEGVCICGRDGGDGLGQGWLQLLDEPGFDSA